MTRALTSESGSVVAAGPGTGDRLARADANSRASSPAALAQQLEALRDEMRARHRAGAEAFDRVHPEHRRGAQNLVDYLVLRRHDMRPLQASLAELGLSSLGRAEEHVITSIERVLDVLQVLCGDDRGRRTESAVGFGEGQRLLERNATALLGPAPRRRATRILVTMPSDAADDVAVAGELLDRGMDCARINAAHDDPERWERMVEHIRHAADAAGRSCPILMDLPGPKLRTGPVLPGPQVLRLRPTRDARGKPVAPARAVLAGESGQGAAGGGQGGGGGVIPVPESWLSRLRDGDEITLRDARGARRRLQVVVGPRGDVSVLVWDTTYLETDLELVGPQGPAVLGRLPPLERALLLRIGDVVTLRSSPAAVSPEGVPCGDGTHRVAIGCSLPEVVRALRVGNQVWFDDGKIGGTVVEIRAGEADVRVGAAAPGGSNLRAGKGINVPDIELDLAAVGDGSDATLRFIAEHADIVGLSFTQCESDVLALRQGLDACGRSDLGIVLKIETAKGFNRLPELLLAGMACRRLGVMVARGDLAVECGFERLAEVQEEILWLCDAAHVPVIWATQVLDQMARTGRPSRAEVSDAAMSGRAECVMLNKGPYVAEAASFLDDILQRMGEHQRKKVALLRRLRSWSPDP